jgi:hypothetical protein
MTTPEIIDYSYMMDKLNNISMEVKIVGEELEEFFIRYHDRINELSGFIDSEISIIDMNENIKGILIFRLDYPIIKSLIILSHESNPWNFYIKDNFKEKMEDIYSDETRDLSIPYYDLIHR